MVGPMNYEDLNMLRFSNSTVKNRLHSLPQEIPVESQPSRVVKNADIFLSEYYTCCLNFYDAVLIMRNLTTATSTGYPSVSMKDGQALVDKKFQSLLASNGYPEAIASSSNNASHVICVILGQQSGQKAGNEVLHSIHKRYRFNRS